MRPQRLPHDFQVSRLYASDRARICAHFLRLDVSSRRSRFCGAVSDEGVTRYANSLFCSDVIICGASIDGQLRGIVELRGTFPVWCTRAEAAFSVEPDWQNIGIGDALFERMFMLARNRGIWAVQMTCLKENSRIRHLAAKHHALLRNNQDVIEAVLHPYWLRTASLVSGRIANR